MNKSSYPYACEWEGTTPQVVESKWVDCDRPWESFWGWRTRFPEKPDLLASLAKGPQVARLLLVCNGSSATGPFFRRVPSGIWKFFGRLATARCSTSALRVSVDVPKRQVCLVNPAGQKRKDLAFLPASRAAWLPTLCSFSGNRMRHARIPLRPLLAAASRLPPTW